MVKESERYRKGTVFEGIVSLRAILFGIDNGISNRKIERVLYLDDNLKKKSKEYAWLRHQSEKYGFSLEITSAEDIGEIAVGTSHGGLIIYCSDRGFPAVSSAEGEKLISEGKFFVMLDGIEDPYNFGYALRSLYSQGADGVILTKRNWMTAAGIVCRSSAGASEMLKMVSLDDEKELGLFKKSGVKIVCADLRDSVSMYDSDLTLPLLLIVGGEKRGISRSVLEMSDIKIRIDYAREFGASLSAASAATVIGAEIQRQNRGLI